MMTLSNVERRMSNNSDPLSFHSSFVIRHSSFPRATVIWCAFLFVLLLTTAVAWACPGCKEALFDPGQLQQKLSTAKGYAWSIALLLACPVALVGGVTALVVRASRRRILPGRHDG